MKLAQQGADTFEFAALVFIQGLTGFGGDKDVRAGKRKRRFSKKRWKVMREATQLAESSIFHHAGFSRLNKQRETKKMCDIPRISGWIWKLYDKVTGRRRVDRADITPEESCQPHQTAH